MQLTHVSTNLRQSLRRNMSMHAAVIVTLFVSLTLAGIGVLLTRQATVVTDAIGSELQLSVYLCAKENPDFPQCTSEVTPQQEATIISTIESSPEVRGQVQEISQQQGLDRMVQLGLVTREQTTGPDPLFPPDIVPKALVITLKDPEKDQGVTSAVADLDGVRNVVRAKDLVGSVFTIIKVIRYAAVALAAVLILASIMLVANTIRLTALARRREIEIMRLVGASRFFIALPFLLEALFNAVVGVALAGGTLAALMRYGVLDRLDEQVKAIPFIGWSDYLYTLVVIGVAGPVITLVPTLLLTRKYLRF